MTRLPTTPALKPTFYPAAHPIMFFMLPTICTYHWIMKEFYGIDVFEQSAKIANAIYNGSKL